MSALSVAITAPSETDVNSSFDITVSADASDGTYDIKAFVENDAAKIISKTLNNNVWKSSNYFLVGVYPAQKTFSLMVLALDNGNVCVRLRKTGTSSTPDKFCQPIRVTSASVISSDAKTVLPVQQTETDNEVSVPSAIQQIQSNNKDNADNEVIYLNSPAQKTTLTNYGKTRVYISYAFAVLAIILLILIAFDKI